MEMGPEGPEDVAHGGPGEEEPEEIGLLGIAQRGLPKAAPVEPEAERNTKYQVGQGINLLA